MKKLKKAAYTDEPLQAKDRLLLEEISKKTEACNTNNLTRTKAYLTFYNIHPEIHWAFLAHMVSRNTGWNMTDLKGSLLPHLLAPEECQAFYHFLERGNWLIFQDAYPQLLLYEESKRQKRQLFHLLNHFHVSVFMKVIWQYFFEHRSSAILTAGLIINEQNHLEMHAIKNAHFQANVLSNPAFTIQDLFSMNQILFPAIDNKKIEIGGITIHQFEDVHKRISIGKSLYALLFSSQDYTERVLDWTNTYEHTGSRKDFWPQLFNTVKEEPPGKAYIPRLHNCTIKNDAPKLYSPLLTNVWKNQHHTEPGPNEWYTFPNMVKHLSGMHKAGQHDSRNEYCATLEKLELAIVGKDFLSTF